MLAPLSTRQAALQHVCSGLPVWVSSGQSDSLRSLSGQEGIPLPQVVVKVGGEADPFFLAISLARELAPRQNILEVIHCNYEQQQIGVAGIVIHWFTENDEVRCADALTGLKAEEAALADIQAVFTLPYDHQQTWPEATLPGAARAWRVPGLDYIVALSAEKPYPLLYNSAMERIPPTWLTLAEAAQEYGYNSTGSLRLAIKEGRLKSVKIGRNHWVNRVDFEAALAQGRLNPRR